MNNKLATVNTTSNTVIPSSEEWGTIYNMAKALVPTGFLPNSIKTPEQATAIMLKGRELNVPPLYALSNIVIVQGKPTVSAEMMLALVQREHGMDGMWVEESTNEFCTVMYKSGNGKKSYTFSVDDAKRAGLTKNPVWTQYPAAMCRARAISAVARMAFPGAIAGMYVSGELGDDVDVDPDTGTVTSKALGAQTATVERIEKEEVIDEHGVIIIDPNELKNWKSANSYFHTLMTRAEITEAEKRAMIRKWNVPDGSTKAMNVDQLRRAVKFVEDRDNIKEYAVRALADEKELESISQLTIDEELESEQE